MKAKLLLTSLSLGSFASDNNKKRKIKNILFLLLMVYSYTLSAQNRWGIVGGMNLSTSVAHSSSWVSFDSRWRAGGYIGGLYDVRLTDSWYIQPQLLFSYEVDRTSYLDGKASGDLDVSTSMYSLTLPVLASFKVSLDNAWALRLNAGPYVQCALLGRDRTLFETESGKQSYSSSWELDFWKRFIVGLKGGVDVERKHWMLSIGCNYSLMKHSLHHHGNGFSLSAGVGYKF